jgi:cation:H+ antiporter
VIAINVLIFLGGLLLLVKGADLFVFASSIIAKRFGVSEFIIGLTLVSIGTSVPELASSLTASFQKESGIVIGNILGSNIANIGLIASTAAILANINTEEVILRRDGYIMFFSSFLLFLFILDFKISRLEASVFILLYIVYLLFLLNKVNKHEEELYFKDFIIYFFKFEYFFDLKSSINLQTGKYRKQIKAYRKRNGKSEGLIKYVLNKEEINEKKSEKRLNTEKKTWSKTKVQPVVEYKHEDIDVDIPEKSISETSLLIEFFKLITSGIAIIIGAKYFVEQAVFFASLLQVPETLIGVSIVAIGTSVPELMVTISAARNDYAAIALGNAIGSNITNILLILGCSGLVHPIIITDLAIYYIAPFMMIITILFFLFLRTGWRIKKIEGFILLFFYLGFMLSLLQME